MKEEIALLKSKLEELTEILKKNKAGYLEICENIKNAKIGKEQVKNNISKIEGSIEGLQFSIFQLDKYSKDSVAEEVPNMVPEQKKGK